MAKRELIKNPDSPADYGYNRIANIVNGEAEKNYIHDSSPSEYYAQVRLLQSKGIDSDEWFKKERVNE